MRGIGLFRATVERPIGTLASNAPLTCRRSRPAGRDALLMRRRFFTVVRALVRTCDDGGSLWKSSRRLRRAALRLRRAARRLRRAALRMRRAALPSGRVPLHSGRDAVASRQSVSARKPSCSTCVHSSPSHWDSRLAHSHRRPAKKQSVSPDSQRRCAKAHSEGAHS
jgi:hypothetical protein